MKKIIGFFSNLRRNEDGATAIEYGLLAALVAVGIITSVGLIGDRVAGAFDSVSDKLIAENIPLVTN